MASPPPPARPQPLPFHWRDAVDLFSKLLWPVTLLAITLTVQKGVERIAAKRAVFSYLASGLPRDLLNVSDYQEQTKGSVLRAFCGDKDLTAGVAVMENEVCKNLDTVKQTREERAASLATASSAAAAARPGDYLGSRSGQQAAAAASLQESSVPVAGDQNWFAVVGTVPVTPTSLGDAQRLAQALQRQLPPGGLAPVAIYRTRISNSYALTIGGPASQEAARAAVTRIRASGIVRDAFWQPDRGWVKIDAAISSNDTAERRAARVDLADRLRAAGPDEVSRLILAAETGSYRDQIGLAVALERSGVTLGEADRARLERIGAKSGDPTLKSAIRNALAE